MRKARSRRTELASGVGAVLDEAPGDVRARTVGSQVLGGDEALLDAAVQPAERSHLVGRFTHRPVATTHDDGERRAEVEHETDRQPPVEHGEHDHHAADRQRRSERLGHHEAEELRHRRDVAVDTLDELTRRVPAVELVVETEHMARHVEPQIVRGRPGGGGRPPGDDHREDLRQQGDEEEHGGETTQLARVGTGRGPVDEPTDDERAGEDEHRRGRHQRTEREPAAAVGPQQGTERAPSRLSSFVHPAQSHRCRSPAAKTFRTFSPTGELLREQ